MENFEILTNREITNWPSWHLVYEWEDDFSRLLDIPLANPGKVENLLEDRYIRKALSFKLAKKLMQFVNSFLESPRKKIAFEMYMKRNFSYTNNINSVPIVIDFWKKNAGCFFNTYKYCKLVCISSIEVYNFLKSKNYPLNIQHLALSLPDKYKMDVNTAFE